MFREVANAVHWFATQIRDLEPAIVYRGAIPQDAKLLRPHLRQVRNFIVALTEIDTSVNRGWFDKQTILGYYASRGSESSASNKDADATGDVPQPNAVETPSPPEG